MKKLLLYLLSTLILLVIVDIAVTLVAEKTMDRRFDHIFFKAYDAETDMAILGASRACHHYNPQLIGDSLHLKVHNYGIDGQNIFVHYAMLQMLIHHARQIPRIIILEIGAIDINDTPQWNTEKMGILYPYYNSETTVREMVEDLLSPEEQMIVKNCGLYRHNSNFLAYLKNSLISMPNDSNGYKPLDKIWANPIADGQEHGENVHPQKVVYLEKFIQLCQQHDIHLILASSPTFQRLPDQIWSAAVRSISQKYHIPFLYHEKDELFLKHGEWFNDPLHLNKQGATHYSNIIVDEIKKLYLDNES